MRSYIFVLATALGLTGFVRPPANPVAQEIGAGAVITPRTNVLVYTSPPEGAFYRKGEVADTARSGERLRVLESMELKTLSKRDLWLKVQPLNSNEGNRRNRPDGWIYAGPVGGPLYVVLTNDNRSA